MEGAAQFCKIYLQELTKVPTVNIKEKIPCTSVQKFLLKSMIWNKLERVIIMAKGSIMDKDFSLSFNLHR